MGDARRPHIVLVLADQVAASALPTYGNTVAIAPDLARLGAEGVVYERGLCASPLCVPSRASLMTGLLPSRTGAIDNAGELPASVPTFAHHLRLLGYRTERYRALAAELDERRRRLWAAAAARAAGYGGIAGWPGRRGWARARSARVCASLPRARRWSRDGCAAAAAGASR